MTRVRPASPQDLPSIESIVSRAYTPYIERIGRKPGPMLDDYGQKLNEATVFVAEDREVVGLLIVVPYDEHLLIENLAVDPACQRRGVGQILLGVAEKHAAELGLAELRLYTNAAMTENLSYYRRRGYFETGRRTEKGFSRVYFSKRVPAGEAPRTA